MNKWKKNGCVMLCLVGWMLSVSAFAAEEWPEEVNAALQEAWGLLKISALTPDPDAASSAVLQALIRAADPSVTFLSDDDLAKQNELRDGMQWDAGCSVEWKSDMPVISNILSDGAAAQAEIPLSVQLKKIGGLEITKETGILAVQNALLSGDSPDLIVTWATTNEPSADHTVTLPRSRTQIPAIRSREDLPTGLGYLQVGGLFSGLADTLLAELQKWKEVGCSGLVLDLRGAVGTAREEIPTIASYWGATHDQWYTIQDPSGTLIEDVRVESATKGKNKPSFPVVVLIDEKTLAAAELLAAVLKDSTRGVMLLGRPTAGDPLVREAVTLSSGPYAWLAIRHMKMADGTIYDGKSGVAPDVLISEAMLTSSPIYEPEVTRFPGKPLSDEEKEDKALRERMRGDVFLQRATDILLGLKAIGYGKE